MNSIQCEVMEKCMGEHFKAGNNLVINVIFMSTKESLLVVDFSLGSISAPRSLV